MAARPALLALLLVASIAASAKEVAVPQLVDVRAAYGLAFVADPPPGGNATWMTELAGGPGLPLHVTYGRADVRSAAGDWVGSEAFLRLVGLGGSKTMLVNSCLNREHGDGRYAKVDFSSHKRFVDGRVVKDDAPPQLGVLFTRTHGLDWTLRGVSLGPFTSLGSPELTQAESDAFWRDPPPTEGMWTARPGTLVQAGDPPWRVMC